MDKIEEKMIDEYIDNHKKEIDDYARKNYKKKELLKAIKQYYNMCLFLEPFKIKYFEDFDITKQGEEAEEIMGMIKKAGQLFVSQINKGETVHALLFGKSGRGKTFLSQIIMCECVRSLKKVLFLNVVSLKQKFNSKEARMKYLKYIKNADLIILDELGAEVNLRDTGENNYSQANNKWQQDLYYIFSICENKNLIVTTNQSPKELPLIYNPNIYSRLKAHTTNTGSQEIKSFQINFYNESLKKDLRYE